MPRNAHNYTQLGIGICGHVVGTWPQIAELGGRNPEVICETCMRERFELDGEEVVVWVRLKETETVGLPKPAPKPRVKKPKPLSPWQTLLQQEGLF
jgi:hypothetical protein